MREDGNMIADAARRLAVEVLGETEGPLHVVSLVEDADPVAKPFLVEIEKRGRANTYACLWTEPLRIHPGLRLATIVHQFVEKPSGGCRNLVVLLADMPDDAEARTCVLRFLDDIPDPIVVLATLGCDPAAVAALESQMSFSVGTRRVDAGIAGPSRIACPTWTMPSIVMERRERRKAASVPDARRRS